MSSLRRSSRWPLARTLAVLWLCLATPAVHDVIVETASWLTGAECCADDCDESGSPCTQQCTHCVCGGHNLTLSAPECIRLAIARSARSVAGTQAHLGARSGHLDPPFRPPVS